MKLCPCGSQQQYSECCGPYIESPQVAPTAEALMRSRYTAFTLVEMEYIKHTHDASTRSDLDIDVTSKWARDAKWLGLDVISVRDGMPGDRSGTVEFKAYYMLDNTDHVLHEIGNFAFKQSEWFYVDGRIPSAGQYVREVPKVGRNEPCPCDSGKKYKKCCGI